MGKGKTDKNSNKPRKKRARVEAPAVEEEEQLLEASLFGDVAQATRNFSSGEEREDEDTLGAAEVPFFLDDVGSVDERAKEYAGSDGDSDFSIGSEVETDLRTNAESADSVQDALVPAGTEKLTPAPAWIDSDDEKLSVSLAGNSRLRKLRHDDREDIVSGTEYADRLRAQFSRLHPSHDASWASLDTTTADPDGVDSLLRSTTDLMAPSASLPQGEIDILRLRDANVQSVSKSVVQSCRFHPRSPILLTAGLDKTLRLFEVDGETNARVASVHMSDMPILRCEFTTDGQQAIAAGRRKYFYVYDTHSGALQKVSGLIGRQEKSLEDFVISPNGEFIAFLGNDGHVLLVSARSKQLVGSVRMNTRVLAACFSPDGRELLTAGLGNEVFRWDLGTRKCVHRFVDDGALRCCALAYSPDGQFIATGAESGVVNIYDAVGLCARQSRSPKPVRSLPHLVNEVCDLRFDNTSQLLSLVSRQAREALKLVHVPSFSVYSNWPTTKTPLGYVSAVDFSPSSGFMTIGNDKGRALLYRLNHFTKY